MSEGVPVVALGVRSQDEEPGKDSAGDQMRIARETALKEPGRFLFAEHVDHGSGYRGNRGAETQQAMDDARRAAAEYGRAELWVFKSERLGRGSGRKDEARSVLEVYVEMRRAGVDLRSVEDDAFFTNPMLVGVADTMAHKYAADLSAHVRRGLAERKASGKPVGAVPIGMTVEKTVVDGTVITKRVIDLAAAPTVERIFTEFEAGHTPAEISKALNADGLQTKRGGLWTTRAVRRVVMNVDYTGTTGYPQLIDAERFERVQASLTRIDPAALQARKGGRPGTHEFLLGGGLAFCRACGAPMRIRVYRNGTRVYRCRNTTEGYGLCSARPVPAVLIERHVLEHLHWFVADLEDWLEQKVAESSDQQQAREMVIERERAVLRDAERKVTLAEAAYEKALADEELAAAALRQVARLERQRDDQRRAAQEAEAVASEWQGPLDAGAALAYYEQIVALVDGKVTAAKGVGELNAALSTVIAGIWMERVGGTQRSGGTLQAEFQLRPPSGLPMVSGLAEALAVDAAGRRIALPQAVEEPSEVELVQRSLASKLDLTPKFTADLLASPLPRCASATPSADDVSRCYDWWSLGLA